MNFTLLFLLFAGVFAASANPTNEDQSLAVFQSRQLDLLGNTRRLIENLVANLRSAVREASDAISSFSQGLQDQATSIRDKIISDLQRLRERVTQTIQSVADRFVNSGAAVRECIDIHRSDASRLLNDTMSKTMVCVDDRIAEVTTQINSLNSLAGSALEFSNNALIDMKKCTEEAGNILGAGTCLGSVAMKTEMKAVVFAGQSGLMIARINLSLAMLPSSLEVCAGSRLVETGMATTRIVMEIGSCSASSVYSTLTGSETIQPIAGSL